MMDMFCLMRDHRASVTVFVTMLLIPSLIITGFMVDLARYKGGFQEMQNVLQLEGSAVLGRYDGLLQDIYGLFAVTQKEEVLVDLEQYMESVFNPMEGISLNQASDAGTFNPYGGVRREITWEPLQESNLRNIAVMQNQITDYMKYRAAIKLLGAGTKSGALEDVEQLKFIQKDSALINSKAKLDKLIGKIGVLCKEYYEKVQALEKYYVSQEEKDIFSIMQTATGSISDCYKQIEELEEREAEDEEEAEEIKEKIESLYDRIESIAKPIPKQQRDAAKGLKEGYTPYLDSTLQNPLQFDEVSSNLMFLAKRIDICMKEAKEQYQDLKANHLPPASKNLRDSITEELKEYEALFDHEGFEALTEMIYTNRSLLEEVCANITATGYGGTSFSELAGDSRSHSRASLDRKKLGTTQPWRLADKINPELMALLQKWYSQATPPKDKTEKVKEDQKKQNDSLEQQLVQQQEDTNTGGAKRIPDAIYTSQSSAAANASQNLNTFGDDLTETVSSNVSDMSAAGFSESNGIFGGLNNLAVGAIDKLLVTEYGVSMFSCAASGKTKKAADKSQDATLSGIPLSNKVNYLYQSEMEYLFAGNQEAAANLLAAQGSIYGIQFVLNFTATYMDRDLNTLIKEAGLLLGAGSPPAVVAATLLIRGAVAGMESAHDLQVLTNGGKVPLVKKSLWASVDGVSKGEARGQLEVEYKDYMRLLLLLFVDSTTVTRRTADLVELNLSTYRAGGGGGLGELFSLEKSYTVIRLKGSIQTNFLFNATPFTGAKDPTGGVSHTITLHRGY